jgi:hypothetical protein
MANPEGTDPTGIAATFVVGGRGDHPNFVGAVLFRDVDVLPVWADGYRKWFDHRDRGHHRVGGRGDHRDNGGGKIRDVGVVPSG